MNPDTGPAPWERQPGESARAYAAFCIYRDMPPRKRSLREVAAKLKGKPGKYKSVPANISMWSAKWRWAERAAAWDEERDRQEREAQIRAVKEMRERHAREAMALQEKALKRLKAMNPEELSPADVLRYFVEAAKLERISRGEPETIQEQRNDWVSALLQVWSRRQARQKAQPEAGEQGEQE